MKLSTTINSTNRLLLLKIVKINYFNIYTYIINILSGFLFVPKSVDLPPNSNLTHRFITVCQ